LDNALLFQPAKKPVSAENPSGTAIATRPVPPEEADGITYFIDCIRNNKPIEGPASAEMNVGVNEIIDAAKESIRTGKAVSLRP
jgi:predicted dehydrogenase